jgi:hypothetical protein
MAERPDYLAYLLRLWRVNTDERPVWRTLLGVELTPRRAVRFCQPRSAGDLFASRTGGAGSAARMSGTGDAKTE